mmetsp:Transcript_35702/g.113485  ORF Transcript_35702/g.113485 Transcript_35702/m.113485 type:complete len:200 (+) Transcript_35702:2047-2646(+)
MLFARKCFAVAMTRPLRCTPRTTAAPILPLYQGSSPKDSWPRPQFSHGSTLIVGSSAAWMSSSPAISPMAAPNSSSSSRSQVAARRLCAGKAGARPSSGQGSPKSLHVMPLGPSRRRMPRMPSRAFGRSSKAMSPAAGDMEAKRLESAVPLRSGLFVGLHLNHAACDSAQPVSMHVCRNFSSVLICLRSSWSFATSAAG